MNFFKLSFILFFIIATKANASDVIMATSEDLKEFDQLISKEPPESQAGPGNQNQTNQKKNRKQDPRKNFEQRPHGGKPGPNGPPSGQQPPQPPPGQDNRPPLPPGTPPPRP